MKRAFLKAVLAAAVLATAGAATAQTKLKWAHVYETGEAYHKWAVWAGDEIKKRTSGRYEVQVLDCFDNKTYSNGQTGSIYKQSIPLANACRKPGEWQTYDIIFDAPEFNRDGILVAPGHFTVIQNGVLLQNHVELKGTTEYIGLPKNIAHGPDFLKLQDHDPNGLVSYRNIWVRVL